MQKTHFTYPSSDNLTTIHAISWEPDTKPIAVLQIVHGMVEFVDRYDEFAAFMADNGFIVIGNDHLGHGKSVHDSNQYGYFSDKDGKDKVIQDIYTLHTIIKEKYPDIPYFILGHSMGSFLTREYIMEHGDTVDKAIIMGTGHKPTFITKTGMGLCKIMALFKGWYYRSKFIDSLGMGGYNKKFGEPGGREWISRDSEKIKKDMTLPECNFRFTLNGYYNLFDCLNTITKSKNIQKIPKDLPLFLVAGADDPVGDFGKGVKTVYERFLSLGIKNVTMKLYPDDRHEILNEKDRENVYQDILNFLKQ